MIVFSSAGVIFFQELVVLLVFMCLSSPLSSFIDIISSWAIT